MPNIIVKRKDGEHATKVLHRFTKSVKSMGMIPHIRVNLFHKRTKSVTIRRAEKLVKIQRREKKENLYRLGKLVAPMFYNHGKK